VLVWKPPGENPAHVWLYTLDDRPLAKALCELQCVTGEELSEALTSINHLKKRDREVVAHRRRRFAPLPEQVTQVIHEHRKAQAAARQAANPTPPPAVRIVTKGTAGDVRRAMEAADRANRKQVLQPAAQAGEGFSRLAESVSARLSAEQRPATEQAVQFPRNPAPADGEETQEKQPDFARFRRSDDGTDAGSQETQPSFAGYRQRTAQAG